MISAERVDVGTEPTALNAADSDGMVSQEVLVKNRGAAAVDLGPSEVTTGEGFELAAGDHVTVAVGPGEVLHAVAAAGTVRCDVLRTGS